CTLLSSSNNPPDVW
nr:immunoglobulin heavy chain junction region [Macaca mulatta]